MAMPVGQRGVRGRQIRPASARRWSGSPLGGDKPPKPGGREKPLSDEGGVPVPQTDTGGLV